MRGMIVMACAAAVAGASIASAGQLHVHEYGLKEALAQHRVVLLGEVVSADAKSVEVTIVEVYSRGYAMGPAPTVGQKLKRPIYQGVEWTDPHKSPIDHRLRDAMRGPPIPGARVIVVDGMRGGVELLPARDVYLRTLAILTAADAAAALAKEPRAALEVDLANPDLVEQALAELTRRGSVSPAVLLRADPQFLRRHYSALSADDKRRFVEAALPVVRNGTTMRDRLWDVAARELDPAVIPAVARLAALYRPHDVDDARRLDDFRLELLSIASRAADNPAGPQPDFSPLVEQMIHWAIKRPAWRSSDDDYPRLTRHLDAPSKSRVAEALLGAVYGSSRSKSDDPDGFLLDEGARLADEAPTPAMLTVLATIDPNRPRVTSTKEMVMDTILRVSASVVKAHPTQAQRARDLVEPLLAKPTPASDEALDVYRKIVGASPVQPPRETILELRPGEMRRLSTGARVYFRRSEEAQGYELAITGVDETSFGLPKKDELDWFRELWLTPFLIVTKRLGTPASPRLHVRFLPHEKEPAVMPQPEAYEQARALLKRRGFEEYLADDFDDFAGWFRYTAADKRGRKGTVVIGTRTRKVVRSTP